MARHDQAVLIFLSVFPSSLNPIKRLEFPNKPNRALAW